MSTLELIQLIIIASASLLFILRLAVKAIKNKWLQQLMSTIEHAVKYAESTGKSGAMKKTYVLQEIEKKCNELGIPYKLLASLIGKVIDTIVKHYNVLSK